MHDHLADVLHLHLSGLGGDVRRDVVRGQVAQPEAMPDRAGLAPPVDPEGPALLADRNADLDTMLHLTGLGQLAKCSPHEVGLQILLGKVRFFTSPHREPSTGSDHCSKRAPSVF